MNGPIPIELAVVAGSSDIPIQQVLNMSRGTNVPFEGNEDEPTGLYIGRNLVAEGRIVIEGQRMSIEITRVRTPAA